MHVETILQGCRDIFLVQDPFSEELAIVQIHGTTVDFPAEYRQPAGGAIFQVHLPFQILVVAYTDIRSIRRNQDDGIRHFLLHCVPDCMIDHLRADG
jgi:hypothetical protein